MESNIDIEQDGNSTVNILQKVEENTENDGSCTLNVLQEIAKTTVEASGVTFTKTETAAGSANIILPENNDIAPNDEDQSGSKDLIETVPIVKQDKENKNIEKLTKRNEKQRETVCMGYAKKKCLYMHVEFPNQSDPEDIVCEMGEKNKNGNTPDAMGNLVKRNNGMKMIKRHKKYSKNIRNRYSLCILKNMIDRAHRELKIIKCGKMPRRIQNRVERTLTNIFRQNFTKLTTIHKCDKQPTACKCDQFLYNKFHEWIQLLKGRKMSKLELHKCATHLFNTMQCFEKNIKDKKQIEEELTSKLLMLKNETEINEERNEVSMQDTEMIQKQEKEQKSNHKQLEQQEIFHNAEIQIKNKKGIYKHLLYFKYFD